MECAGERGRDGHEPRGGLIVTAAPGGDGRAGARACVAAWRPDPGLPYAVASAMASAWLRVTQV